MEILATTYPLAAAGYWDDSNMACGGEIEIRTRARVGSARHRVCILSRRAILLTRRRSMKYIDQRKVNKAIRECLANCEQASDILARIEGFLLVLKVIGGWREAELHEVEVGVRKVLYGILEGATYPRDATNILVSESAPDRSLPKVNGI